jgi:hypothetical protein
LFEDEIQVLVLGREDGEEADDVGVCQLLEEFDFAKRIV